MVTACPTQSHSHTFHFLVAFCWLLPERPGCLLHAMPGLDIISPLTFCSHLVSGFFKIIAFSLWGGVAVEVGDSATVWDY